MPTAIQKAREVVLWSVGGKEEEVQEALFTIFNEKRGGLKALAPAVTGFKLGEEIDEFLPQQSCLPLYFYKAFHYELSDS